MFKIDTKDVDELEKDLETFKKRALPFATKATINDLAWTAREIAQKQITKKFVERNKWTGRSVMVNTTRTLSIRNQASEVGSTQDYMRQQEEGAIQRGTGTQGKAIPTSASAGQKGAQPRTKVPMKTNRIQNIMLERRLKRARSSKAQNLVVALKLAKESGDRHVFLKRNTHAVKTGVYRINRNKLTMVQSLEKKTVRINPTPWLQPSSRLASKQSDRLYRKNLLFQLRRHHVLGY